MSSGSGFNHPPDDDREPDYDKIMVSAIICLILVLFVLLLHFYARWIWLQSARFTRRSRQRLASARRRFYFTGEEPARLRNVGLDSAILETLPMFVYTSQNFTDGLECAVCLCELEENQKGRLLPNCRHSFHVDCIDMWFLSHSTCPLCRTCAQPQQPILESATIEQVSATSPGPIVSRIHEYLNSEQGQTASSEEEYDLQNPTNILSWCKQEQTNADIDEGTSGERALMLHISIDTPKKLDGFWSPDMDEGTSGGRAVMPHIAIDIPKKRDGLWSSGEGHQFQSPNGSQSSSKSSVTRLHSFRKMFNRDRERKIFPSDHPCECDVEQNGPAQGQ